MGILFQQMTGVTEVYSSAPASLQTSIKASFNSNVIGTGILITFESPDPHLIQFVDRGIFEIKDNKRVDSPNYSMIRYGLSGDTGKNTRNSARRAAGFATSIPHRRRQARGPMKSRASPA